MKRPYPQAPAIPHHFEIYSDISVETSRDLERKAAIIENELRVYMHDETIRVKVVYE